MDWSNADNYEFTSSLDREGWAWEFLRRNGDYQADYEKASSCGDPVYDPPKLDNESDTQWISRVIQGDDEPNKQHPLTGLAARWGLALLQDPAVESTPEFLPAFPFLPEWSALDALYGRETDEAPIQMKPDVAVIAFDVSRPLSEQFDLAKRLFFSRQTGISARRKNWKPGNWTLYLRLLDAKGEGVTTSEIIAAIDEYSVLPNDAASGYLADDRVSDHFKQARRFCSDPLSVLR